MAKTNVEFSKVISDKKSVDDLYGQLERLKSELERILHSLDRRIEAIEER
ncbi:MAG: hypothetical protein IIW33_02260 [Oscillospiraceae bacterium]|nr:hypothetical protein [Oscillospiraceae bacterium]